MSDSIETISRRFHIWVKEGSSIEVEDWQASKLVTSSSWSRWMSDQQVIEYVPNRSLNDSVLILRAVDLRWACRRRVGADDVCATNLLDPTSKVQENQRRFYVVRRFDGAGNL